MAVIGKIIAMTGVANIINEKGESRAVVPGEQLQTGDTLQTPAGVTVKVQLENGRVIDVAAGQMVSFTEELTNVIVPDETDNAVDLATIDTVIDAIENGQDLDEVLEATAAGGAGGSEGGHSAVFLDRINLFLNGLSLNTANDAANDIVVNPTNGFLNPLLAEQFVATPAADAPITVVSVTSGIEDPNNPGATVGDQVIEGVETDPLLFQIGLSAVPAGGEEVILTFGDITAEFGVDTASTISIDFGDGNGFVEFPVVGNAVTVAVPAGAQNFVVSLATLDDTAVEDLEQLTLTASTINNVGTLPSATGGIIDNDGIVFVQSVQAGTGTFNPTIPGGINGSIVVEGDVNDPLLFQVGLNAATPLSGAIVTLFFENSGDAIFGTDTTTDILIDIGDGNGFVPVQAVPQTGTGPNNEVETFYNVELPANVQNFVVSVPTIDDDIEELAERILFTASTVNNDATNPAPNQVTGTILDDDTPLRVDAVQAGTGDFNPTIPGGVDGSVVTEGDVEDPLLFEVELNRVAQDGDEVVTLSFTNGTAIFGTDTTEDILIDFGDGNGFVAVSVDPVETPGSNPVETTYAISVPAGIQSFVVSVPTIDDEFEEPAENILFTASTVNNDATNPAPTQVTGTILDDDTTVYVNRVESGIQPVNQPGADPVGDQVDEGEPLFFSVGLNTFAPVGGTVVSLAFIDDSAEFGVDTSSQIEINFGDGNGFLPVTVSPTTDINNNTVYNITVPEGVQSFEVKVPTVIDTDPEVSERLFFTATTTANETLPFPIPQVPGVIFDNDFELPTVSGLNGEYYGYNDNTNNYTIDGSYRIHGDDETSGFVAVGNLDSIADIETIIDGRNGSTVVGTAQQSGEGVPDVRFYATTLRYGLSGTQNEGRFVTIQDNLGANVVQAEGEILSSQSALATFLADDASSAIVQEGSELPSAPTGTTSGIGNTTDSIVRLTGSVFLERGNYDFRVYADDGFRMKLGGETVFEYDGNAYADEYEFKNLSIDGEQAGLTSMELIYWEQGRHGVLHVEYKLSSEDEYRTFSLENLPMFPQEYPDLVLADNQTIVNTGTVENPVWEIQTGLNVSGVGTITGSERADILSGSDSDDTLDGLGGSDDLNGGAGNDILIGGAGNDRLDGGTGADDMRGGAGDDYYVIDNAGDIFEEVLDEGTDTIVLDASYNPGTFDIKENFENLDAMGDQAISVDGTEFNNRIQTGAGDDTIDGGAGDDWISGGAGNDVLTGGDGSDVFEWSLSDKGQVGAPAIDRITDFQYSGNSSDAIDLRDLLQDEVSSIRYGGNIGNLLDYLEISESAGSTTINISSSGNIAGGADQQIILENVNLFSDAGVGAGDQAALLHNLLNNGTLIVD